MRIARNVVRENLRNKVLYLLAFLGILTVAALLLGGTVQVQDEGGGPAVNLTDSLLGTVQIGFTIIGLFSAVVAVVLSMNTVPREFERKTIHLLLVRPVERWQVALELLLGNVLTALALYALLSFGLVLVLAARGANAHYLLSLVPGLLTLSLNVAFTACLTTLLSARLPGAVTAFLGLDVYVAGALRGVIDLGLQMKISALERGASAAFWEVLRSIVLRFVPPVNEIAAEAAKCLTPGALLGAKVYVSALIWLYFAVLFHRRQPVRKGSVMADDECRQEDRTEDECGKDKASSYGFGQDERGNPRSHHNRPGRGVCPGGGLELAARGPGFSSSGCGLCAGGAAFGASCG